MGHNYYGEPAWPNDILFIFPVVIIATFSFTLGMAIFEPLGLSQPCNPFSTPLEILPEWYFFPTFNLLRMLSDKFIGVVSCLFIPLMFLLLPFLENINIFQNPFRRSIGVLVFLSSIVYNLWLGIGAVLSISFSLPLL
jgi:cytochrome b6/f complex subunit IV